MNKTLILDVGGVLASNLTPTLWEHLASLGNCDKQALYSEYKRELSERLWCGLCSEEDWRSWLMSKGIKLSFEQSNQLIAKHLCPLPAIDKLEHWAQRCSIVVMSNHRSEWLLPLLHPYNNYLKRIYISDKTGLCKPNPKWFQIVDQSLPQLDEKMFVDDSNKNVNAAKLVGWQTVLADSQGNWINKVDKWLYS